MAGYVYDEEYEELDDHIKASKQRDVLFLFVSVTKRRTDEQEDFFLLLFSGDLHDLFTLLLFLERDGLGTAELEPGMSEVRGSD